MKLLLHMCCAPCSTYIVENLKKEDGIYLEGYFYNPNIHPLKEFYLRKRAVEKLAEQIQLPVFYSDDYNLKTWKEKLSGDKAYRCKVCYSIRLNSAALYASKNGFDAYTSSLLISPYQDHELIKELGERFAQKHNVKFIYKDFRPFFREGQKMAKNMRLYRQKYCGCIYSYYESDYKKKPDYSEELII